LPGSAAAALELSTVLAAAQAELGGLSVVSLAPDGRRATLTATLPDASSAVAGRALAAWAVAHATTMHVTDVSVGDRSWADHAWTAAQQAMPAGEVTIVTGS
jgi:hypothetical protein